jgi:hypothetical protein
MTFPIPNEHQTTWQVGTGNDTRYYFQIMLDYGIICIGPGRFGPAFPLDFRYGDGSRLLNKVVKFATVVNQGDWVVAKSGKKRVLAIGKVVSDYAFSDELDDIEGWDIQHYRKVKWWVPAFGEIHLEDKMLSQSAFCSLQVWDRLFPKLLSESWLSRPAKRVLKRKDFSFLPLSRFLPFDKKRQADELSDLILWYIAKDYFTSEYELTCHCVVPFLKLLGWRISQIKLEHKRVDVMLFKQERGHLEGEVPEVIIEVKKFGNGLADVGLQALNYYKRFEGKDLKPVLVVTNGMRWNILEPMDEGRPRVKGGFSLGRLRERDSVWAGDKEPIDTRACLDLLRPE